MRSLLLSPQKTTAQGARSYLSQTAELFFPKVCASCWSFGETMVKAGALCPLCDRLVRLATLAVEPTLAPYARLPIYTSGRYEYELARSILAFKDGGRTDLCSYLVNALGRCLKALSQALSDAGQPLEEPVYLVPMPSSRVATRRRGFAPAPLLARSLSQAMRGNSELPVLPALEQLPAWRQRLAGKANGAQKTLGRSARQRAMAGKLRLGRPPFHLLGRYYSIKGRQCLLVDDVVTTGASLAEAQRVLTAAGAQVRGAIAVARVPRNQGVTPADISSE